MKTIYNSVLTTLLCSVLLGCAFVIVGLVLNFWNEDMFSAGLAFVTCSIIGIIVYFGIIVLVEKQNKKRR